MNFNRNFDKRCEIFSKKNTLKRMTGRRTYSSAFTNGNKWASRVDIAVLHLLRHFPGPPFFGARPFSGARWVIRNGKVWRDRRTKNDSKTRRVASAWGRNTWRRLWSHLRKWHLSRIEVMVPNRIISAVKCFKGMSFALRVLTWK